MRIVELKRAVRDGDGERYMAVFEQDGARITKLVEVSYTSAAHSVSHDRGSSIALWMLVRKAREAVRDFAYMKHGDQWKEHVEWGGFFDAPTDEEKRMIEEAFLDS